MKLVPSEPGWLFVLWAAIVGAVIGATEAILAVLIIRMLQ